MLKSALFFLTHFFFPHLHLPNGWIWKCKLLITFPAWMNIFVPLWIYASTQGSTDWSIMLSALPPPPPPSITLVWSFSHYPFLNGRCWIFPDWIMFKMLEQTTPTILHPCPPVCPDSDTTSHLRQGHWLRLSGPSWETHHRSGSQRNPR